MIPDDSKNPTWTRPWPMTRRYLQLRLPMAHDHIFDSVLNPHGAAMYCFPYVRLICALNLNYVLNK